MYWDKIRRIQQGVMDDVEMPAIRNIVLGGTKHLVFDVDESGAAMFDETINDKAHSSMHAKFGDNERETCEVISIKSQLANHSTFNDDILGPDSSDSYAALCLPQMDEQSLTSTSKKGDLSKKKRHRAIIKDEIQDSKAKKMRK